MFTSYTVGAVFELDDRASGQLTEIADKFARLEELARSVQESLSALGDMDTIGGLAGAIDRIGDSLTSLNEKAASVGESLVRGMTDATARTVQDIDSIGAAFTRATQAANTFRDTASGPLPSASRGGGDGAYEDRDGWNSASRGDYANAQWEEADRAAQYAQMRRQADQENRDYDARERQRVRETQPDEPYDEPTPSRGGGGGHGGGGLIGMVPGLAPFIEGLTFEKSMQAAAREDLAIRNTLIEGLHIRPDNPNFQRDMDQMRQTASDAARGTIYSESEAARAMPVLARELGFTGEQGMQMFSRIFRPSLQAAEVAQMTGLGDLYSSLSASVEFAHMTGAYDPAQLEQQLNVLRAVAQLTNQTMASEESIVKYSVPIGMAAGMNPDDVTIQTGFLQQQGLNSTTAGTGLSALMLGVLNTGGGLNAHLEATRRGMEREFEAATHLSPAEAREAHGAGGRGSAHTRALENLGITHGGQLTVLDAQGNLDMSKIQGDIRTYAETHTKQELVEALHDAFGTRGERVAAIYAEPGAQAREERFRNAVQTSPTATQIQTDLSQSPMQQFEQMLANIANIGNTLANPTLSGVNEALKTFNAGLIAVNDFLKAHPGTAEAGGYAVEGGLAAGAAFGARRAWNWVRGGARSVARGASELAGEAGEVGGEAAEVGGGLLSRVSPWLALLTLGGDTPTGAQAQMTPEMRRHYDQEWTDYLRSRGDHAAGVAPAPATHPAATAPHQAANTTPAPAQPASVTVHLGGVTMNGVADESTYDRMLHKLTDALKGGLAHATGAGQGSDSSIFVYGGGS